MSGSSQAGETNFCLFLIGLSAFILGPYLMHFRTLKGRVCQDDWQALGPVRECSDFQGESQQLSTEAV